MTVISLIFILAFSQVTLSQSAEVTNCLQCASKSATNSFCTNSATLKTNPWEVKCCTKGNTGTACTQSGANKCFQPDEKSKFYSGCPQMKKDNCGLQHNFKDLNLYAETDKKTFTYNQLRYKTKEFKQPTYQACVYNILTPPGGYTGGKVYLTIKKPEAGVTLYLNKNGKDTAITYGSELSVKNEETFSLTAVPSKDNYNTSFTIEYRTDGNKDDSAAIFEELESHQDKISSLLEVDGGGMGMGTGAIIGTIIGSLAGVAIAAFGIMQCRKMKNADKVTRLESGMKEGHQLAPDNSLNETQANAEDPYTPEGKQKIKAKQEKVPEHDVEVKTRKPQNDYWE